MMWFIFVRRKAFNSWLFQVLTSAAAVDPQHLKVEVEEYDLPNCSTKKLSEKKLLTSISSTYWLLSFCKILKKFLEPIQRYEDMSFSGRNQSDLFRTNFLSTSHYYYFHLTIGPFHWAKFQKNSSSESRVMRMHHFWTQMVHLPQTKTFFEKNH